MVAATLVAVAAQDVDVINMAIKTNSMLPDYQEKQRLLFGEKINSESLRHYAQLFLQAGNLTDAADFFVKLTDNSGLEKVLQQAENDGDLFLAERTAALLKRPLTPEQYNKLGEQAVNLGKSRFALQAFEKAGNQLRLTTVQAQLGDV